MVVEVTKKEAKYIGMVYSNPTPHSAFRKALENLSNVQLVTLERNDKKVKGVEIETSDGRLTKMFYERLYMSELTRN